MEKVDGNITKGDFCKVLQKHLAQVLGHEVSLETAYTIFKTCQLLPYQIANKKNFKVTLAGIGVYRMYKTRSGNKVPKYYGSETVIRTATQGYDLMDYVLHPQKYRNPEGVIEETPKKEAKASTKKEVAKEASKKEASKVAPKKEASKVAPKKATKEAPKKVQIEAEIASEVDDFDIDDFEL